MESSGNGKSGDLSIKSKEAFPPLGSTKSSKKKKKARKGGSKSGRWNNQSVHKTTYHIASASSSEGTTQAVHTPTPAPDAASISDYDYALALQLQAQFEQEGLIHSVNASPEKVVVSPKLYPTIAQNLFAQDELNEDEDDSQYFQTFDEEYNERFMNPHAPVPAKLHHQAVKTSGRQKADEFYVTKHDYIGSQVTNARRLEKLPLEAGNMRSLGISGSVLNSLKERSQRSEIDASRKNMDKKDKRTKHAIDENIRMRLMKWINGKYLSEVNGTISKGKEAHVYHALAGHIPFPDSTGFVKGGEYALKIYFMDLSGFKDRTKYVSGDYRFRFTPTQNARKAIKIWAEKEFRNLLRLEKGGILCPHPVAMKSNILVMGFLGKRGVPSPLLKDANLTDDRLHEMYLQCVKMMRKMYQKCELVHADLSEYNIIYHKHKLWFIDVSQSIQSDHQNALEFLRRDCKCITEFFKKRGVSAAMRVRELFEFITDCNINDSNIDECLEEIQKVILARLESGEDMSNEEIVQEYVFQNAFIPSKLSDVNNPLNEIEGQTDDIFHTSITGLNADLSGPRVQPKVLEKRDLKDDADSKDS